MPKWCLDTMHVWICRSINEQWITSHVWVCSSSVCQQMSVSAQVNLSLSLISEESIRSILKPSCSACSTTLTTWYLNYSFKYNTLVLMVWWCIDTVWVQWNFALLFIYSVEDAFTLELKHECDEETWANLKRAAHDQTGLDMSVRWIVTYDFYFERIAEVHVLYTHVHTI